MPAAVSLKHDDYTIGWICPLRVEQFAAIPMLDRRHKGLPQAGNDGNLYTLGDIDGFNIVIAGLPHPNNGSASSVAANLKKTFKHIRFVLLVGIGGGVPNNSSDDIVRLGDVVVSKPARKHSGALLYDLEEAVGKKRFACIDMLPAPPKTLLAAADDFAANRHRYPRDPLADNISRIDTRNRAFEEFAFPGSAQDNLHHPGYKHEGTPKVPCTRTGCNPARRIPRPPRQTTRHGENYVTVHRGIIASGDLVVKDPALRDAFGAQGVLCFECEAAGTLYSYPAMVIRGISDYCDSHKNDVWHAYAAAAAAAYARQLFFHLQ